MKTPGNQPETAQSEPQKHGISQAGIDTRLSVPFSERMQPDLYIRGPASWQNIDGDGGRIAGECGAACSGCQSSSRGGCGAVAGNMEGEL